MIETINLLAKEEEFYSNPFFFSYSSLSKLAYSPKLFYSQYVLKEKEEKTDLHLIEGKVIHCLLLEEHLFEEKFSVSPQIFPSDSVKNVIDYIYKYSLINNIESKTLIDYKDEILNYLKNINLYQSLKTDEQRIEKVVNDSGISYFIYLKESEKKDVIDKSTYEYCREVVQNLMSDYDAVNALKLTTIEHGVEIYSEKYLETQLDNKPFGIKGLIDRLIIDHNEKSINVVDFKTTGKAITEFPESVDYYKYWLQASIYRMLVEKNYLKDLQGYSISFKFVVVDKYKQNYVFNVSDTTAHKWLEQTNNLLKQAEYHYTNRRYNLPYDFDMGLVIL